MNQRLTVHPKFSFQVSRETCVSEMIYSATWKKKGLELRGQHIDCTILIDKSLLRNLCAVLMNNVLLHTVWFYKPVNVYDWRLGFMMTIKMSYILLHAYCETLPSLPTLPINHVSNHKHEFTE